MKYGQKQGYIFRKKLSTGTQKEQNWYKKVLNTQKSFSGFRRYASRKQYHAKISLRMGLA
jgi:hypothetical protein